MNIIRFFIFAILGVSQSFQNYTQLGDHTKYSPGLLSKPTLILVQGHLSDVSDTLWIHKEIHSAASIFDYEELFSAPAGRKISYVEVKNKLRNHVSATILGGSEHPYVILKLRRTTKEPIKCEVRMYLKPEQPKEEIGVSPKSTLILAQGNLDNDTNNKLYFDKPVYSETSPWDYITSYAVPNGQKISYVEVINELRNQASVSISGGAEHSYVTLGFIRNKKAEIKCRVRIYSRPEYTETPMYSSQKIWIYGLRDNYTDKLVFDRGIFLSSWASLFHSELFQAESGQKISCIEVKGANASLVPGTGPGFSNAQLIFKSQKPNATIEAEIRIYVKPVHWPEPAVIFSQGKRNVLGDKWEFSKEISANQTIDGFNKTIHAARGRYINFVEVANKSQGHVNVAIVSGGHGQPYVTLKFKGESNEPIRCQVRIYTLKIPDEPRSSGNSIKNSHLFLCILLLMFLLKH